MNADEYRKLAEVEDEMWYFRALHGHVERELAAALGERAVAVLDAGCGTGGLIRRLAPRHEAWQWTGVDVSPLACELARERTGTRPTDSTDSPQAGFRLRQGDGGQAGQAATEIREASVTALPWGEATFDAVVSADVLYHVDDDAAALREFFRVLRPGGTLVVNVPAYRWLWSYHDEAVHARRRYARSEVLEKLRAAGFAGARATHWNALPFPLVVARRKLLPAPGSGSDVRLYPAPIEAAFNAAMAVERAWLRGVGRLPFGSSILAVARKP